MTIAIRGVEMDHAVVQERVIEHGGIDVIIDLASCDSLLFGILIDKNHEDICNPGHRDLGGIEDNFSKTVHLLADQADFFASQAADHILGEV